MLKTITAKRIFWRMSGCRINFIKVKPGKEIDYVFNVEIKSGTMTVLIKDRIKKEITLEEEVTSGEHIYNFKEGKYLFEIKSKHASGKYSLFAIKKDIIEENSIK